MARASKLPSGNWRVLVYYKDSTGKDRRKSITASTKKEAERDAALFQLKHKEAQPGITLKDAYYLYIENKNAVLSPAVVYRYRNMALNDFPGLLEKKVADLTQNEIQKEVNLLAGKYAPKTVSNKYGLLISVIKSVRPDFYINIKLPQRKAVKIEIPSETDIKTIYQVVKGSCMEVPFLLASQCGLRAGEICALTHNDIDLERRTITINKSMAFDGTYWVLKEPKTYSGNRVIPCHDLLIDKIVNNKPYKTILPGINFICGLNPQDLTHRWEHILFQAKTKKVRFHALRHYYCSQAILKGVPKQYIIELMGHSSSKMVDQVYSHTFPDAKENYAKKMVNLTGDLLG